MVSNSELQTESSEASTHLSEKDAEEPREILEEGTSRDTECLLQDSSDIEAMEGHREADIDAEDMPNEWQDINLVISHSNLVPRKPSLWLLRF